MFEIVLSSSSDNVDKAINVYNDPIVRGTLQTSVESGVPGLPLEVIQEGLRMRFKSSSKAGMSAPSSTDQDEVEVVYSCAIGVVSKMDDRKLDLLRKWYQIPDKLNPRLAIHGEWCCQPRFGIGIYEAYLLGGLRLPLNTFARELLTRLGLGVCQFNPNSWRLVVSMQVLWREVFEGGLSSYCGRVPLLL